MDLKNTLAAVSLSAAVIIIYGLFFAEPPKNQEELLKEKEIIIITEGVQKRDISVQLSSMKRLFTEYDHDNGH